jgi:alkanesulfonate monooxygenase SsuD/methylene tetrahydromethanopterin reductase-like flavin-dependent oxidoreductase (luciferase family)
VVADTREEAMQLALPNLRQMARLRTGGRLGPAETVEEALAGATTQAEQRVMDAMLPGWIVDAPEPAAVAVQEFAARFGADELMVSMVAGGRAGDPADRYPARERTLELLAGRLLVDEIAA